MVPARLLAGLLLRRRLLLLLPLLMVRPLPQCWGAHLLHSVYPTSLHQEQRRVDRPWVLRKS